MQREENESLRSNIRRQNQIILALAKEWSCCTCCVIQSCNRNCGAFCVLPSE